MSVGTYFEIFSAAVSLRDQDVLEVGGAVPPDLIDDRGIRTWTAVDISPNRFKEALGEAELPGWYRPMLMDAAAMEFAANSFDVIYSTDCFEHVANFSSTIRECFRVLRPGGLLFTKFAPIWSGPKGHHAWVEVDGSTFTFNDGIVPDWQHLMGNEEEFQENVRRLTPGPVAEAVTEYSLHSDDLNRLCDDDFLHEIEGMPWRRVVSIKLRASAKLSRNKKTKLTEQHPSVRDFRTDGFFWVLAKPPFPVLRALKAWITLPMSVAKRYGFARLARQVTHAPRSDH